MNRRWAESGHQGGHWRERVRREDGSQESVGRRGEGEIPGV